MTRQDKKTIYAAVALLVCLLGFALYAGSFRAGFQFDDYKVIVENPSVKHLENIKFIWQFDPTRVLVNVTFAMNYAFSKFNVVSYHVVNLFIHMACSFLVFYFLKTIFSISVFPNAYTAAQKNIISVFSALIFLVHPLQTESVTYIVQRSTALMALFYLLSVVSYLLWRVKGVWRYYYLSVAFALLGAFTKPNIISLPLVILLVEFCFFKFPQKDFTKRLVLTLPFCLVFVVVFILLLLWRYNTVDLSKFIYVTMETDEISRYIYLLTQLNVLVTYLRLLFLPLGQNLDYDYPLSSGFFGLPTFLSFIIIVCVLYFAFKVFNQQRLLSFGMFWFFLTLLPESSIFPLSDVIFEHRLYLPMVGFGIFICTFLLEKLRSNKKTAASLVCLIVVLSFLTIHRNRQWVYQEGLLRDTAAKSPFKGRPANNLGDFYYRLGKIDLAEEQIRKAIELNPENATQHYNLGVVLESQGRIDEAMAKYREAISKDLFSFMAYFELGRLYKDKNDLKKAEIAYKACLLINENYTEAHINLGNIYVLEKKYSEAITHFRKALELNPYHLNAYNGLAGVYYAQGDYEKAIAEYNKIIRRHPDFSLAYINLGNVYVIKKDLAKAEEIFKKALTVNPKDAQVYQNLANVYYGLNRSDEANEAMKKAIELFQQQGQNESAEKLREYYFPGKK